MEMILKIIKLYVCFEKFEDKLHIKTGNYYSDKFDLIFFLRGVFYKFI